MADIFLSYSQRDRDRVQPIVSKLENEGLSVWWDTSINPGETFRKVIASELERAGCVVVAWSRTSVESNWVIDEAEHGRDTGKLIPINLDGIKVPIGFRQIQTFNFPNRTDEIDGAHFEALLRGIRKVLGSPADDRASKAQLNMASGSREDPTKSVATPVGKARNRLTAGRHLALYGALLFLGLGSTLYWAWSDRTVVWEKKTPNSSAATTPQADSAAIPASPQSQSEPTAVSALPKAALIELDTAGRALRFEGSIAWSIVRGPWSQSRRGPQYEVRGDIKVPARDLAVTLSVRRETEVAGYAIDLLFDRPANSSSAGIEKIPNILVRQTENEVGTALLGSAKKVSPSFFLFGLSTSRSDAQRDLGLLKERALIDIPIVYNDGRGAILALRKGEQGERVFEDVFKGWGQ